MKNKINSKEAYYVFDLNKIDENINILSEALNILPNYQLSYSTKTNCLKYLIKYFNKKNIVAECVSNEEYDYLCKITKNKDKIVFNGPCKDIKDIKKIIKNNSYINIDSLTEAYDLLKFKNKLSNFKKIGIRININIGNKKMNQLIGFPNSRFGVADNELDKIITEFKNNNIEINGLHFHINSNYEIDTIYNYCTLKACEIIKKYNLHLSYIDLGGGILRAVENINFKKSIKIITNNFKKNNIDIKNILFIFEPGAALIANSAKLYSQVKSEKNINGTKYITLNITKNYFNITNKFTKWKHYNTITKNKNIINKQIICGFTCMENDIITILENQKELSKNDTFIIEKVGAYSITLSPIFIKGIPTIYFIKNNKIIKKIPKKKLLEFW